jgi:hypothetical protein
MTNTINIDGTRRISALEMDYNALVTVFGEPDVLGSADGKTQAEWRRMTPEGTVFTIYDYKAPTHYSENTHWNVGGHNYDASMAAGRLIEQCLAVIAKEARV